MIREKNITLFLDDQNYHFADVFVVGAEEEGAGSGTVGIVAVVATGIHEDVVGCAVSVGYDDTSDVVVVVVVAAVVANAVVAVVSSVVLVHVYAASGLVA